MFVPVVAALVAVGLDAPERAALPVTEERGFTKAFNVELEAEGAAPEAPTAPEAAYWVVMGMKL